MRLITGWAATYRHAQHVSFVTSSLFDDVTNTSLSAVVDR